MVPKRFTRWVKGFTRRAEGKGMIILGGGAVPPIFQGNGTAWKVEIYRYRMQPGRDIVVDSEAVSTFFWRRAGSGDSEQ